MSYGVRGSAVEITMASYRLAYPYATDEELKRGAEWTIRLAADPKRFAAHEAMSDEDRFKEIERQMFGPGDHSTQRA
jgi:hypothetical protein